MERNLVRIFNRPRPGGVVKMSETKVASNLVSESSLRHKQESLRDKSIEVPTVESILADLERKQNGKQ